MRAKHARMLGMGDVQFVRISVAHGDDGGVGERLHGYIGRRLFRTDQLGSATLTSATNTHRMCLVSNVRVLRYDSSESA